MSVGSARSLKTGMSFIQALAQPSLARFDQALIRSPAAGGVALLGQHGEAIARRAQMLFAAQREISLNGGTEGVDVAVGMLAREYVDSFRQWIEVSVVFEETRGHLAIENLPTALIGEEEIFGQSVALIPCIRLIFVGTSTLLCPRQRFFRQVRRHRLG